MFKYTVTSKLLKNIKEIAVLVAELNSKSFTQTVLYEFETKAQILSSHSSTSIEGNPLPLTAVKKLLKERPENIRDTEKEVLNYNRALDFLKGKRTSPLDSKLILDIHKIVMDKLLPKAILDKFRQEPVFVNNPKTGKTVFWAPNHCEIGKLMSELIEYITKNTNKVDALILSGIFHKQFIIIHPFIDGNGRTTRLITKHLLASLGLDTFNLFSFENYYNNNVTKYFEKVGVRGDYYDLVEELDFTKWLEYFTEGIIDELLRVGGELKKASASPDSKLEKYHKKIISHLEKNGYITDKIYSDLTERAKATRILDFKKLINLGIIERHGSGRATHYKLKEMP